MMGHGCSMKQLIINLLAMPLYRSPETVTEHVRARWHGAYDELREVRCVMWNCQACLVAP